MDFVSDSRLVEKDKGASADLPSLQNWVYCKEQDAEKEPLTNAEIDDLQGEAIPIPFFPPSEKVVKTKKGEEEPFVEGNRLVQVFSRAASICLVLVVYCDAS